MCDIKEVKVSPCKEVPKACKFKRDTHATIEMKFVPSK